MGFDKGIRCGEGSTGCKGEGGTMGQEVRVQVCGICGGRLGMGMGMGLRTGGRWRWRWRWGSGERYTVPGPAIRDREYGDLFACPVPREDKDGIVVREFHVEGGQRGY